MNQDGYYERSRSEALDLLPACPRRVLDIGCGRGGVTRELKRRCPETKSVGLDLLFDPEFDYSLIFEDFSQVNLDQDELPVDVHSFDLVLLLDVLEHLCNPNSFLEGLVNKARDRCYFLVSLPNFHYYSNLFAIVQSGRFQYREDGILDRTHLRFFGRDDAKDMLSANLTIVDELAFNPFENLKSRLVGHLFGDRYRAYQNIYLCQK